MIVYITRDALSPANNDDYDVWDIEPTSEIYDRGEGANLPRWVVRYECKDRLPLFDFRPFNKELFTSILPELNKVLKAELTIENGIMIIKALIEKGTKNESTRITNSTPST